MDAKSALLRLWELDEEEHGRLLFSIFLSVTAVLCGLVPYFVVSSLLAALLAGRGLQRDEVFLLCFAAFVGYLLRSILYAYALSVSHKAAFSILREVRWKILQKLPKLPLGTVTDLPVGEIKHIIVDQVESTERTLAQLYDLVFFVAQDAYLFDDSIRENIRMGRPRASDEEVDRAARAAGCEDFILRLAHGYGTRMSGQRMVIAMLEALKMKRRWNR